MANNTEFIKNKTEVGSEQGTKYKPDGNKLDKCYSIADTRSLNTMFANDTISIILHQDNQPNNQRKKDWFSAYQNNSENFIFKIVGGENRLLSPQMCHDYVYKTIINSLSAIQQAYKSDNRIIKSACFFANNLYHKKLIVNDFTTKYKIQHTADELTALLNYMKNKCGDIKDDASRDDIEKGYAFEIKNACFSGVLNGIQFILDQLKKSNTNYDDKIQNILKTSKSLKTEYDTKYNQSNNISINPQTSQRQDNNTEFIRESISPAPDINPFTPKLYDLSTKKPPVVLNQKTPYDHNNQNNLNNEELDRLLSEVFPDYVQRNLNSDDEKQLTELNGQQNNLVVNHTQNTSDKNLYPNNTQLGGKLLYDNPYLSDQNNPNQEFNPKKNNKTTNPYQYNIDSTGPYNNGEENVIDSDNDWLQKELDNIDKINNIDNNDNLADNLEKLLDAFNPNNLDDTDTDSETGHNQENQIRTNSPKNTTLNSQANENTFSNEDLIRQQETNFSNQALNEALIREQARHNWLSSETNNTNNTNNTNKRKLDDDSDDGHDPLPTTLYPHI